MDFVDADLRVPVVKQFLSERGSVSADDRTNRLIIRDTSKNIEEIQDLFP